MNEVTIEEMVKVIDKIDSIEKEIKNLITENILIFAHYEMEYTLRELNIMRTRCHNNIMRLHKVKS